MCLWALMITLSHILLKFKEYFFSVEMQIQRLEACNHEIPIHIKQITYLYIDLQLDCSLLDMSIYSCLVY